MSQKNHSANRLKNIGCHNEMNEDNINVGPGQRGDDIAKNLNEYRCKQCLVELERNIIIYTNMENPKDVLVYISTRNLNKEISRDQLIFLNQVTLRNHDDMKSSVVVLNDTATGNSTRIPMIGELAFEVFRSLSIDPQLLNSGFGLPINGSYLCILSHLIPLPQHLLKSTDYGRYLHPMKALPAADSISCCFSDQGPIEKCEFTSALTIKELDNSLEVPHGSFGVSLDIFSSRCLVQSCLSSSPQLSESEIQLILPEHVLNGSKLIVDGLMFFLLLKFILTGFRFDFFFALCSNAIIYSRQSVEFLHLPFVPGELITIQSLLYDASYCHESNHAFFLKVAFRDELAINYLLPYGEAVQFYRYGVQVAFDFGDEVAEARMLLVYGQLLGRYKEYLGLAYLQFRRALGLLEPRGKCIDLAWLLTATGWNLFSRGLAISGQEYLIQAVDMMQELLEFSTGTFRQSSLFSLGPSVMEEEERRLEQKLSATASSLGLVYLHLNTPQEALKHFQKSLTVRLGLWERHPAVGNTYNNISLCYQRLGKYDEALDCSRKGLAVKRQFQGNGKEMVNSLNNVAINCSLVLGNHEEAIELLEEALLILETRGMDTSDAATIYTSLGFVYQRMGRLDAALPWCQKAVDIRREISGNTHPTTMRLIIRLGSILYQMAKFEDAKDVLEVYITQSQSSSGNDFEKLVELLKKVYLETGANGKANLVQQNNIEDFIILLNKERNAKQAYHVDLIKEDTEGSTTNHAISDAYEVGKLPKKIDVTSLDDIDSDDDLYGPEDSTLSEAVPQRQSNKTEICNLQMKPLHDTEKLDAERGKSEGDLYHSRTDAGSQRSALDSSECVSVDAAYDADVGVSNIDSYTFHHAEITNSIKYTNQVQQPAAEIKPAANCAPNHVEHHTKRPQKLRVSSQSAFTSIRRLSTQDNNTFLDNMIVDNRNQIQSLSNVEVVKQRPISQPEHEEASAKPFRTFSGVIQEQQENITASHSNGRKRQALAGILRKPNNPFHSCQIGYQQYNPEPTYAQSLPYLGNTHYRTGVDSTCTEVSDIVAGKDPISVKEQETGDSNGIKKTSFQDLEDIKLLTSKKIEGSRNVLRLVFGDYDESSDEELFP